ncbi:DUF4129 domain-containing protein [Spirochaeta dissipatitropha]
MKEKSRQLRLSPEQRYRRLIHPAMALLPSVLPALLVGLSLISIFRMQVHPIMLIAFTLFSAAVSLIFTHIFKQEKAGVFAGLREFVLLFGLLYLVYSMTRSGEFLQRLQPGPGHFVLLLPSFYAWMSSADILKRLENRLLVLSLKEGVARKDLNTVMRNNYDVVGDTIQAMRSLQSYSTLVLLATALYSMVIVLVSGEVYLSLLILFPAIAAGFFWFRSQVVQFWQELTLAAEGIPLPMDQLKEQSRIGWYILITAAVFSVIVARGAILPAELLLAPFLWLARMFENEELTAAVYEQMSNMQAAQPPPLLPEFSETAPREPGWFITVLFPLIRQMLRYALFLGLGLFLFAPFFSRSFRAIVRRYGFLRSILAAIRYFFMLIWSELRGFLPGFSGKDENYRKVQKELSSGSRAGWDNDGTSLSRKKKRELDMLSKAYDRLLSWAEKRGVPVRRSDPPQHFGGNISNRYPDIRMQTERFIEIFEEGFYSERELSAGAIQEFGILQREIRRKRS